MANGNIEILIRKSQTADGTAPSTEISGEEVVSKEKEQGKPSVAQSAVNTAIINAGKQAMMQGIKHYGTLTGNYQLERQMNMMLGLTADMLMIAKGGPVGVIAVATRHALSIANSVVEQRVSDREQALAIQRAGEISLKASRYSID
jgi:hypothetical protein